MGHTMPESKGLNKKQKQRGEKLREGSTPFHCEAYMLHVEFLLSD